MSTNETIRSKPAFSIEREQVLLIAIGALVVLLLLLAPTYYVGLVAVAGINAIAVMGLGFLLTTGQLSLGHAAFLGLGSYASALLTMRVGLPVFVAVPAATAICALIGYGLGKLTLQLKGHYLPLATLAYGMAISVCFVAAMDLTGGASGFTGIPPLGIGEMHFGTRGTATLIWVFVGLLIVGYRRIYRGRVGRVARALKSNAMMASAFGVDVPAVKIKIFVLSTALAGFSGSLYAFYMQFLSPASFSVGASFNLLIMAVLGGVTHPLGAILGVIFFSIIELSAQYVIASVLGVPGQLEAMVFGVILIVTLLKWPQGLVAWAKLTNSYDIKDVNIQKQATEPKKTAETSLAVDAVSKKFGGVNALSIVSLKVPSARITGLIGPNGAGKSTLFNVMTGVLRPTQGNVILNDKPLPSATKDVIVSGVARTFQHVQLVQELDVLQNVLIGAYTRGKAGMFSAAIGTDAHEERTLVAQALAVLQRVGLLDVAGTVVSALPLGSQRLVEVARALLAKPQILLLDEPAAGLRAAEKEKLSRLLQTLRDEDGVTVLIVEHDMELVMNCADYLFVLNYGSLLAQGEPAAVQKNPAVISAYLGTEA